MGFVVWDLPLGTFDLEALAWELKLGKAWELSLRTWLGIFSLETSAWELWLGTVS